MFASVRYPTRCALDSGEAFCAERDERRRCYSMEMPAAADILLKWYVGENNGHALFADLAFKAGPAEAHKWRRLGDVENVVAARLHNVLAAEGIAPPVLEGLIEFAAARTAPIAGKPWDEIMRWFEHIAARALRVMEAEAAFLPPRLAAIGELVLAHERALVAFAARELAEESGPSLEPIETFLQEYG